MPTLRYFFNQKLTNLRCPVQIDNMHHHHRHHRLQQQISQLNKNPLHPSSITIMSFATYSAFLPSPPLHSTSLSSSPSYRPPLCTANKPHVVIVGAGISGLSVARSLPSSISVTLLDSNSTPGGRMQTTKTSSGFTLDHGFHVFLLGYPSLPSLLDYHALDLRPFLSGAILRKSNSFLSVYDPLRHPFKAFPTILSYPSIRDKLSILQLRLSALFPVQTQTKTFQPLLPYLRQRFTESFVDSFFRPFYKGIFLESLDRTDVGFFQLVFGALSNKPAALPRAGIGEVAKQLVDRMGTNVNIRLGLTVRHVEKDFVKLDNGEILTADAVVVAVEEKEARKLLALEGKPLETRSSTCVYWKKKGASPVGEPVLVLNAEQGGVVNNMHVVTDVVPEAAPDGWALISTTVVGDAGQNVVERVRQEMTEWFGEEEVKQWEMLDVFDVPYAQPGQEDGFEGVGMVSDGVFLCGDWRAGPTVETAVSGARQIAESVHAYLQDRNQG